MKRFILLPLLFGLGAFSALAEEVVRFDADMDLYFAIDDGNHPYGDSSKRADRGPHQTPKYVSKSREWMNSATSSANPDDQTRALWSEADRIIRESGFNEGYSALSTGGVDFSDTVEVWFILGLGDRADSVEDFWVRYIVAK